MSTASLSRCPIEDVLPWLTAAKRPGANAAAQNSTILIQDRVQTSGRFLLFVTVANAHHNQQGVLWLSFSGAYTIELMQQGLKKMGCLVAGSAPRTATAETNVSSSTFTDATQRLTMRAVAQEMAETIMLKGASDFDAESFVRGLYRQVSEWVQKQEAPCLLLLDDVSALADLVGPRLAFTLVYQIRAKLNSGQARLLVRCAGDYCAQSTSTDEQKWIGVSGENSPTTTTSPFGWESCLVDLVDLVVDVLPLQSGYSREAHGRLLLTPRMKTSGTPTRCNYCLTDQAVFAIRLTTKTFNLVTGI